MHVRLPAALAALLLLGAVAPAAAEGPAPADTTRPRAAAPVMTVYKSPTCGCCTKWVDHVRAAGFTARVVEQDDRALDETKATLGVGPRLQSCHTAIIDGYVIEGHVPAEVIVRLLKERPKVVGIAVPGMPQGSPGMETGRVDRYEILTFDKTGRTTVYDRR